MFKTLSNMSNFGLPSPITVRRRPLSQRSPLRYVTLRRCNRDTATPSRTWGTGKPLWVGRP
jgi:hypothetical protein